MEQCGQSVLTSQGNRFDFEQPREIVWQLGLILARIRSRNSEIILNHWLLMKPGWFGDGKPYNRQGQFYNRRIHCYTLN